MNKIYSVSINCYKMRKEIKKAIAYLTDRHGEVRDVQMLAVLIHEGVIKGEKIKIGGKLSKLVKENKSELLKIMDVDVTDSKP